MKSDKKRFVPILRFLEFENHDGWNPTELGKIGNFTGGGTPSKNNQLYWRGSIPWISSSDIDDDSIINIQINRFISDVAIQESATKIVPPNSILLVSRVGVGKLAVTLSDICTSQDFTNFTPYKDNVIFLAYYLKANAKKLLEFSQGMAIKGFTKEDISKLDLFLPSPAEQQKIATCLSSLDDLIAAHKEKLEALKAHKKGLMQQLFPAEGELLPRLRFEEFAEAGNLQEKRIEDFFDVGSSKRVLEKDWTNEGVPFYRTRELVSLSKKEPFSSEVFISEELFLQLSKKYGIPKEGDFLVSGVGTLGISYQVKDIDRFYFKDGNVLWLKKYNEIESSYFKYCFDSNFVQKQIFGQASISTVGTYTIEKARQTRFWYSHNNEEQHKIAELLSSIDELITAQTEIIAGMQKHKKGLMQGLFPNAN